MAQAEVSAAAPAARRTPLASRNFILLWLGQSVSLLGDQFHLVALPWLALQLTGSGLALGTVLLVAGIPRAIFMLVGGALTDRFSPRTIMLMSDSLRAVLTALLMVLVVTNLIQFWMLFFFAFMFGLIDAFFHPAYAAMLPRVVARDQLEAGNAALQITAQLVSTLGPALAGGVIAATSVAVAFGVDAGTFFVSVLALLLIRLGVHAMQTTNEETEPQTNVLSSIAAGVRYVRADPILPTMLLISAALNVLFNASFGVGVPVLANTRFPEGAAAVGVINSAFGAGALVGVLLAAVIKTKRLGVTILSLIGVAGALMIAFGAAPTLPVAAVIGVVMGVLVGYVNIGMTAWLQKRIDQAVMGRVMSLVMLSTYGLTPIGSALAGAVVELSPVALFAGSGIGVLVVCALGLGNRAMRSIETA
jgi:predicted MFS family arabinose efflux permease